MASLKVVQTGVWLMFIELFLGFKGDSASMSDVLWQEAMETTTMGEVMMKMTTIMVEVSYP